MNKTLKGALSALLMTIMVAGPAWGQAGPVSSEDAARIRSVIDQQIDAFRRDDGAGAYSHAAPGIRKLFPSVEGFMAMVKQRYQPVYRPRSYGFEDLRVDGSGTAQVVRIVGPANREWIAIYTFEKQPDGTWKISGVYIQAAPGRTT